jgi:hypothetical protein
MPFELHELAFGVKKWIPAKLLLDLGGPRRPFGAAPGLLA